MSAPSDSSDGNGNTKLVKTDDKARKGSISKTGWECMECEVTFMKDSDMLLQCQYCEKPKCISCLGMTKGFYKQLSGRDNLPWFCDSCLGKAIESVKTTKSIEDRCNDFLYKFQLRMESRLENIESDVAEVKKSLGKMRAETVTGDEGRRSGTDNIVKQATHEMQSRMDRKNNIAFYGVHEASSNVKEECVRLDTQAILEICGEIGVDLVHDDIKQVKRTGQKGIKKSVKQKDGDTVETVMPRVVIGSFTESTKARIMRSAYKLSASDSDYLKTVGIKHDMTKEERLRDQELRREARDKNINETENFVYLVRGMPWERRIVKIRKGGGPGGAASRVE